MEALWQEDCKKVKERIGKTINVVFCGSDYDENSFWNKLFRGVKKFGEDMIKDEE